MTPEDYYKKEGIEEIPIIEWLVLDSWWNENNKEGLSKILLHGDFSPPMKHILADILTGKLSRPVGKKPLNANRNIDIFDQVSRLLNDGYKLTSNSSKDGAAAIVADTVGMKEDAVIKIYSGINKDRNKIIDMVLEYTKNRLIEEGLLKAD